MKNKGLLVRCAAYCGAMKRRCQRHERHRDVVPSLPDVVLFGS
ncbi:hypothetical protein [Undibacterium jejuense]|nr:hypothetical protein [Undibacterium jejuense]